MPVYSFMVTPVLRVDETFTGLELVGHLSRSLCHCNKHRASAKATKATVCLGI